MELTGKKILYVGDNAGLDNAIKIQLIELGAEVYQFEELQIDIVECRVKEIVSDVGPFDGLVYGVAHSDFKPLQFVKPDIVNHILNDNYNVFVEVIRALKKSRGLKPGSSIVAMSSISSIRAMKAKMVFCAAKAALDASIRCLALELGDKKIRINSVQKGGVDVDLEKEHIQDINALNDGATEKKQLLGLTKAIEVANVVAFLLSDATMTITGTSIVIDGGYTL